MSGGGTIETRRLGELAQRSGVNAVSVRNSRFIDTVSQRDSGVGARNHRHYQGAYRRCSGTGGSWRDGDGHRRQGAKTTVTDAEGRFNLPFLTPGVYGVRAELQGFKAIERGNVTVSLGQTIDLPLTMEVGGLTETVEVTARSPIIDTSSTTTGAVMSSEMFSQVPVGRRVSDTLYMAPGVSTGGSAGAANPSISGGSGLDNQYVIDGVNVTNQGYGALGSYSIVFGSLGNATPFDFIKEVQVKTGGYEAEFGQSTGGVVNVVTKSGIERRARARCSAMRGRPRPKATWTQDHSRRTAASTPTVTHVNDAGAEGRRPDLARIACSSSARSIRRGTPAQLVPTTPAGSSRCSRRSPDGARPQPHARCRTRPRRRGS